MSLSDPIGDMLARLKNSQSRNHKVEYLHQNLKSNSRNPKEWRVYNWLQSTKWRSKINLQINLKYNLGNPVINSIERVSKYGRRVF